MKYEDLPTGVPVSSPLATRVFRLFHLNTGFLMALALAVSGGAIAVTTQAELVAHWKFDESTGQIAHDETGRYDGTLYGDGAAFVAGGVSGNALLLERAQNGLVVMPHLARCTTNDFSVAAWARLPAGDTTSPAFVFSQHEMWYENGFLLLINREWNLGSPGKATFIVNDGYHCAQSTTDVTDSRWHHMVVVYRQSGQMEIYVDGSGAERSLQTLQMKNRGAPFIVGGVFKGTGAPDPYYTGLVDDVQVYDEALSDAHIELLFLNPGKSLAELGQVVQIVPSGGWFEGSVEVRIVSGLGAAVIRYTLDGSEPSYLSQRYTSPFTLRESTTVKARLFINDFPASDVCTATYTKMPPVVFTPPAGLFTNAVDVALRNTLNVGSIFFTLSGVDPTLESTPYSGPIRFLAAATIKARVFFEGFPVSDVFSATYARVYALDDGIPNSWREKYFGPGYLTDPRVGAPEDPDQDGSNNLQEYMAGSDPLDATSGFAVGIHLIPMIKWMSVPDTVYRILRKTSLQDTEWTVVAPEFKATETNSIYIDPEVAGKRAFYTIEVKR